MINRWMQVSSHYLSSLRINKDSIQRSRETIRKHGCLRYANY